MEDLDCYDREEELETVEDVKRFQELEARGFQKYLFDNSDDAQRAQYYALIDEANANGWPKESIFVGINIYLFIKRG